MNKEKEGYKKGIRRDKREKIREREIGRQERGESKRRQVTFQKNEE